MARLSTASVPRWRVNPQPRGHRRTRAVRSAAMKRVLVVQHEPFEGPGTLASALSACELRPVAPYAGERVPDAPQADGLVVLGGGMGVYEADRYPYLRDEM